MVFAQQSQQGAQRSLLKHVVPALRAVTSDVTKGPDGLLPYVVDWGGEQLNEFWDGTGADDSLSVLRCAGRDICERPSSLELVIVQ